MVPVTTGWALAGIWSAVVTLPGKAQAACVTLGGRLGSLGRFGEQMLGKPGLCLLGDRSGRDLTVWLCGQLDGRGTDRT